MISLRLIKDFLDIFPSSKGTRNDRIKEINQFISSTKKGNDFIVPKFIYSTEKITDWNQALKLKQEALNFIDNNKSWVARYRFFEKDINNIIIPDFQREYKWEVTVIKRFYKSIMNDDLGPYSSKDLGSIILSKDSNEDIFKNMQLIDGQQRITTLYLIKMSILTKYINNDEFREQVDLIDENFYEEEINFFINKEINLSLLSQTSKDNVIYNLNEYHNFIKRNFSSNFSIKVKNTNLINKFEKLKFAQLDLVLKNLDLSPENSIKFWKNIWDFSFSIKLLRTTEEAYSVFYKTNSISVKLKWYEIIKAMLLERSVLTKSSLSSYKEIICDDSFIQLLSYYLTGIKTNPENSFSQLEDWMLVSEKGEISLFLDNFFKAYREYYNNSMEKTYEKIDSFQLALTYHLNINKDIHRLLFVLWSKGNNQFNPEKANLFINNLLQSWIYSKFSKTKMPSSNDFDSLIKKTTSKNPINSETDSTVFFKKKFSSNNVSKSSFNGKKDKMIKLISKIDNQNLWFNVQKEIYEIETNEEYDVEHFISREAFNDSKTIANLFVKSFKIPVFKNKNHPVNLFYVKKELNKKLKTKEPLKKAEIMISSPGDTFPFKGKESLFKIWEEIISSDASDDEKNVKIIESLVSSREAMFNKYIWDKIKK